MLRFPSVRRAAATLGYNGVTGAILVQVKNASNNQFIKNIKFFE